MHIRPKSKSESGQAMLEFAMVAIFLTFVFAGAFTIGAMLNKALQVSNVTRSAAVLMVRSLTDTKADLNLALSQNQRILIREASGLSMAKDAAYDPDPAGSGAIFLSKIILVGANECASGTTGKSPPWSTSNCANYGSYVYAYYVAIGNNTRWASAFGSPATADVDTDGTLSAQSIATHTSDAITATKVTSVITLSASQYALMVETYADVSNIAIFAGYYKPPVIYYRTVT